MTIKCSLRKRSRSPYIFLKVVCNIITTAEVSLSYHYIKYFLLYLYSFKIHFGVQLLKFIVLHSKNSLPVAIIRAVSTFNALRVGPTVPLHL